MTLALLGMALALAALVRGVVRVAVFILLDKIQLGLR